MTDPQTAADEIRGWLDAHPDAEIFEFPRAWLAALLAERDQLAAELEQVRGAVTVAAELIDRLALESDCNLTFEDVCWIHGGKHQAPCPHPLGRQFVEAWRAVQAEGAETTATRPADGPDATGAP